MGDTAQPPHVSGVKNHMEAVAALERDAELMLRVREGDDTSFALLLEKHRGPVVNFMQRMVENRAACEAAPAADEHHCRRVRPPKPLPRRK